MKHATNWFVTLFAMAVFALDLPAQSLCFEKAMQTFHLHRWAEAAGMFAECEKSEPGRTPAVLFRGKALVNLGRFDDAASALENYISIHPGSEDAVYLLAYVRFRQDKPKESLQLFTAAAKLHDPTADDLKVVGLDYVLLGDYEKAAHRLEECLALDPANVEARYHLGRVRYQQNRFDLAIAAFQEVLRRDPNSVKAEDNLGLALEAKNETDAALSAYSKAVKMDENQAAHNEQPYLDLGTLLAKSGRAEEAIALLIRAAAIQPNSGKTRYQLAKVYSDMNRFQDALPEALKAASLEPRESSNHYLLGRIYQRSGKSELAREQFRLTEQLIQSKSGKSDGMASGAR